MFMRKGFINANYTCRYASSLCICSWGKDSLITNIPVDMLVVYAYVHEERIH